MNFVFHALLVLQIIGGDVTHTVRPGDSLTRIGAYYGVEVRVIAKENGIKPSDPLRPGQTLQIDNRHIAPENRGLRILVNIPQRMMFLYEDSGVRGYPIAAGKPTWRTPIGPFTILTMEQKPVWHVPVSIQEEMRAAGKPVLKHVPPSPANPLGKYWLGTSLSGIGIHGTNAPASIFSLQTHGCIRLHPDNIEDLFNRISVGTTGETVYEPVLLAQTSDGVYLEVHSDVYGKVQDSVKIVHDLARQIGVENLLDWTAVTEIVKKHDGIARRVLLASGILT
jgi:L,D-transpeptidase ErfK/SrfK